MQAIPQSAASETKRPRAKPSPKPRIVPLDQRGAITAKEAADYLGVSKVTLWRHRDAWGLKPFGVGRAARYRMADVRATLERLAATVGGQA